MGVIVGMIKLLEFILSRILLLLSIVEVIIFFIRFEYSYDQYHWYPIAFIVIIGVTISSIIYKVFIDGRAINTNRQAGTDVQKISV